MQMQISPPKTNVASHEAEFEDWVKRFRKKFRFTYDNNAGRYLKPKKISYALLAQDLPMIKTKSR